MEEEHISELDGELGTGSDSMKIMAEKHSVIRAHLEQAELELEYKKSLLRQGKELPMTLTKLALVMYIAHVHVRTLKIFFKVACEIYSSMFGQDMPSRMQMRSN